MVILCGSYVGFMEREVLGKKSPLFGRRTAQILLRPFGFEEATAFHRGYPKVPHFPNPANATIGRRVFVRKKGRQTPVGVMVHDLESFL